MWNLCQLFTQGLTVSDSQHVSVTPPLDAVSPLPTLHSMFPRKIYRRLWLCVVHAYIVGTSSDLDPLKIPNGLNNTMGVVLLVHGTGSTGNQSWSDSYVLKPMVYIEWLSFAQPVQSSSSRERLRRHLDQHPQPCPWRRSNFLGVCGVQRSAVGKVQCYRSSCSDWTLSRRGDDYTMGVTILAIYTTPSLPLHCVSW